MRLVADSGLWSTGRIPVPTPLVAVLEVSGAVLSWTVDDPLEDAATQITFTDLSCADWLWRVLGESGHIALASALGAVDGAAPKAENRRASSSPASTSCRARWPPSGGWQ